MNELRNGVKQQSQMPIFALATAIVALAAGVLFAMVANTRLSAAKQQMAALENRLQELEREATAFPAMVEQSAERAKRAEDAIADIESRESEWSKQLQSVRKATTDAQSRLASLGTAVQSLESKSQVAPATAFDQNALFESTSPVVDAPEPSSGPQVYSFKITGIEKQDDPEKLKREARKFRDEAHKLREDLRKRVNDPGTRVSIDTKNAINRQASDLDRKANRFDALAAKPRYTLTGIDSAQRLVICHASIQLSERVKSMKPGDQLSVRGEVEEFTEDQLVLREAEDAS